ncbi:MAG TPA: hypothetical protein VF310_15605, partial [Vicinamibacteria bacterium]
MPWRSHSRSSLLVTPLLVVILVITALLALQAHGTFVYHRATAERALRDFAALAGGELVRRSTTQLGYDGYFPLLAAAARRVDARGLPADLPRRLAGEPDARLRRAAGLARRFFVAAPEAGRIETAPAASAAESAALLARLRAPRAPLDMPFRVEHDRDA